MANDDDQNGLSPPQGFAPTQSCRHLNIFQSMYHVMIVVDGDIVGLCVGRDEGTLVCVGEGNVLGEDDGASLRQTEGEIDSGGIKLG